MKEVIILPMITTMELMPLLYWKMAAEALDKEQTQFYKMQAVHIDKQVIDICNNLKAQKRSKSAERNG